MRPAQLSSDELALGDNESPSDRELRLQLSDQLYEADSMRRWFADKLRTFTDAAPPWEYIEQHGDWCAKAALVKDRIERFGFQRRIKGA